jgi:hypothetical protein
MGQRRGQIEQPAKARHIAKGQKPAVFLQFIRMLCVIIHNILQLLCICPIRFCTRKLFAVYNPGIPLLSLDAVPKNRI